MTEGLRSPAERVALGLACGMAVAIAGLSLYPLDLQTPLPGSDKAHHLIAYAALIFPLALIRSRSLVWALPLAFALGVGIEIAQPWTGRFRELGDIVANLAGLALGVGLGLAASRVWGRGRRG